MPNNILSLMQKLLFYCFIFFSLSAKAETSPISLAELPLTFPKERKVAPDFKLVLLDGNSISLSSFKGKVVLLNFWATFCSPCRKEMPALETLWKKYKKQGLVVIAVSIDRSDQQHVQRYVQNAKLSFPVGIDTSKSIQRNYEVKALPITYIIGRDGKFIARAIGERHWANKTGLSYFENLLQNK